MSTEKSEVSGRDSHWSKQVARIVKQRKDGILTPHEFFRGFVGRMIGAAMRGDRVCWAVSLDAVPLDLLAEINQYAEAELKPIEYRPHPDGFYIGWARDAVAREKIMNDMQPVFRELHGLIADRLLERLASDGAA